MYACLLLCMYRSNVSSQTLDNKANSLATRTLSGQGELRGLYQPHFQLLQYLFVLTVLPSSFHIRTHCPGSALTTVTPFTVEDLTDSDFDM